MNAALMEGMTLREPAPPSRASQGLALLTAIGLHGVLGAVLLTSWTPPFEPQDNVQVLRTQLVSLPKPAEPQAEPEALPDPLPTPEPPAPEPIASTEPAPPSEAELAFKRAEKERAAEEVRQQKLRQQRETAERERQAREVEQLRLAREAERAAETQRLIEAERARTAAAAEQARRAAAAAAADRQYLPIAKVPPMYPQRALDSGVQGECTVSYDVDPNGRVVSPQVTGQCHPLFVRPSLNAAKRFRYRPRIVNGQAVTVRNVQNTFHYRIE